LLSSVPTNLFLLKFEGSDRLKVSALECQGFMNQFLSMFLQFVETWKKTPKPNPDTKYAQVGAMPREVIEAVAASLVEWQEISVAEHLGEAAFRSAEWIPFDRSISPPSSIHFNALIVLILECHVKKLSQ
jgi:hypothetical protein